MVVTHQHVIKLRTTRTHTFGSALLSDETAPVVVPERAFIITLSRIRLKVQELVLWEGVCMGLFLDQKVALPLAQPMAPKALQLDWRRVRTTHCQTFSSRKCLIADTLVGGG